MDALGVLARTSNTATCGSKGQSQDLEKTWTKTSLPILLEIGQ